MHIHHLELDNEPENYMYGAICMTSTIYSSVTCAYSFCFAVLLLVYLTLSTHAQEGYCSCTSVRSHLTSGASVRPENTVTYSAGNGGQRVSSENTLFKSCGVICHAVASYRADAQFFDDRAF